jgi:hypothetical protein
MTMPPGDMGHVESGGIQPLPQASHNAWHSGGRTHLVTRPDSEREMGVNRFVFLILITPGVFAGPNVCRQGPVEMPSLVEQATRLGSEIM